MRLDGKDNRDTVTTAFSLVKVFDHFQTNTHYFTD